MQITSYLAQYTGLSEAALLGGPNPLVRIAMDADGLVTFPTWSVPGKAEPTSADIASAMEAPHPIPELAALVTTKCMDAANAVTLQIVPDDTHRNAYLNAATIVTMAGGVPETDPAKSAFAAMASANGQTPTQFATLVTEVQLVSLQLGAAIATLRTSTGNAVSASDLRDALTTFQSSLAAVVSSVQGAGLAIVAPAAITVQGVNA